MLLIFPFISLCSHIFIYIISILTKYMYITFPLSIIHVYHKIIEVFIDQKKLPRLRCFPLKKNPFNS